MRSSEPASGAVAPTRKWQRVLRFLPLYLALRVAGVLAALAPRARWRPIARTPWRPGLSVLIPERGTPDLLADTLDALELALAPLQEPVQVLVVVNGAPAAAYDPLRQRHPRVEWQFHPQPLGFNGAVAAGLAAVRHDWTYLLNSDMRLAPDALQALLPWRQPQVFAITSQIRFADPARRREETGWSGFRVVGHSVEMFEREPESPTMARGNLYSGGGSSLCRTAPLRAYVRDSACYSPFYWEDAEWGARAWADGWEVLFCPLSHATHEHRGTVRRFHAEAEVERVFARNAMLFELRQHWTPLTSRSSIGVIDALPAASARELARWRVAAGVLRRRLAARRTRDRGLDYHAIHAKYYPQPLQAARPRLLLVSPFALFPPAHGGARRIAALLQRFKRDYDVILLSDERSAYGAGAETWFEGLCAVHLVEGRGDQPGQPAQDLPTRLRRHAHERLRHELRRLQAVYRPDVVQVEYMELAALALERGDDTPWVLGLHDVYLDGGAGDALQREHLARFDALTACSAEDAALLGGGATLVPNGAIDRLAESAPSSGTGLLFMGPFRYAPNQVAIEGFLRECWPAIRAALPTATLTILGGAEAGAARADPLYAQPGVELVDRFVDPAPYLARAALTINPQMGIRGSALKLAESLLAARCCVSTRDGARGFAALAAPGLVQVDGVAAMAAPVIALLRDERARHAIERPAAELASALGWDHAAQCQLALYRELHQRRRRRAP